MSRAKKPPSPLKRLAALAASGAPKGTCIVSVGGKTFVRENTTKQACALWATSVGGNYVFATGVGADALVMGGVNMMVVGPDYTPPKPPKPPKPPRRLKAR